MDLGKAAAVMFLNGNAAVKHQLLLRRQHGCDSFDAFPALTPPHHLNRGLASAPSSKEAAKAFKTREQQSSSFSVSHPGFGRRRTIFSRFSSGRIPDLPATSSLS